VRNGYWNTALDAEENDGIPVDPTEFEVEANADADTEFVDVGRECAVFMGLELNHLLSFSVSVPIMGAKSSLSSFLKSNCW
jgi:hypothetical protein